MYFSCDRRRTDHWSLFSKYNQAAAWKTALQGFLGGSLVKNSPANSGDTGLILDPGRPPRAVEQLGLCTTVTEPVL